LQGVSTSDLKEAEFIANSTLRYVADFSILSHKRSKLETRLGWGQVETETRNKTMLAESTIEQKCIDAGLKMTGQRRVIARVLSESEDHPDVELVYRRATDIDPKISIATVYRTVRLFEEADILEKHDFGDGRARYEELTEEHHDHLIDMRSGEVIEFSNDKIEKLQEEIAKELGFRLVGHRLELYGVPLKDGK
jgi:Fur family ferric uptake transcriptional regulator